MEQCVRWKPDVHSLCPSATAKEGECTPTVYGLYFIILQGEVAHFST